MIDIAQLKVYRTVKADNGDIFVSGKVDGWYGIWKLVPSEDFPQEMIRIRDDSTRETKETPDPIQS